MLALWDAVDDHKIKSMISETPTLWNSDHADEFIGLFQVVPAHWWSTYRSSSVAAAAYWVELSSPQDWGHEYGVLRWSPLPEKACQESTDKSSFRLHWCNNATAKTGWVISDLTAPLGFKLYGDTYPRMTLCGPSQWQKLCNLHIQVPTGLYNLQIMTGCCGIL